MIYMVPFSMVFNGPLLMVPFLRCIARFLLLMLMTRLRALQRVCFEEFEKFLFGRNQNSTNDY